MRYEIDAHGFRVHQKESREMNRSDKVVVITGCSSGFGAGAVKAFADEGYRVWGTMRDAQGRNAATGLPQDPWTPILILSGSCGRLECLGADVAE
jgi:NAD(P)-dependent dehydrogenase (short-subunit alcohol dehydrogenase family)